MRIVAFGCSWTYGLGLDDCVKEDDFTKGGSTPSQFAWPQLLADKLSLECVNQSRCGASNKEIWFKAVNFEYQKNDIVVVLWTFVDRYCILKNENSIDKIGPWIDTEHSKQYYRRFHSDFDSLNDTYLRYNHLRSYLNDLGLLNHHISIENLENFLPKWNLKNFLPLEIRKIADSYTKTKDNLHPGFEAHQAIATALKQIIKL
jgi:hypothetical protein